MGGVWRDIHHMDVTLGDLVHTMALCLFAPEVLLEDLSTWQHEILMGIDSLGRCNLVSNLDNYSTLISVSVIKHREFREGKALFQVTIHHWGKLGQKLKKEFEAEIMEEYLFVAHLLPCSASGGFFIQFRTICWENGATHRGSSSPIVVNNQDNHGHTYQRQQVWWRQLENWEDVMLRKTIIKQRHKNMLKQRHKNLLGQSYFSEGT